MAELLHREPCGRCGGHLGLAHCNPCHRLFAQCTACQARYAHVLDPAADPGRPPAEPLACPRCEGTEVRPATRSDLENRGWLGLLLGEDG